MKKLIFISLILLVGCTSKAINQADKEEKKNNPVTKDTWIYNTPWGKSAAR